MPLTTIKVGAFKVWANRIARKEGDVALVRFVEENREILEDDQLADVAELAGEAYDRLEAKEAAEKAAKAKSAPRVYTEEETRRNATNVVADYDGFEEAAKAMATNFELADAKKLVWVCQTVADAMKATRDDGKWLFHGWVRDAMRIVRNRAYEQANEKNTAVAMNFLAPLLAAWKLLAEERISRQDIDTAEKLANRVRPSYEWPVWAKKALEQCICTSHPALFDVLVDLADEVKSALPEHRGASALIDGLLERIPGIAEQRRQKIAKEKAVRESKRRARQTSRAADSCKKKK
jgi:hypothetical protein